MKPTLRILSLLAACGMAMPALASDCAITIASDDKMQFDIKNVVVPKTCRQYTMTLTHVGKMSKATMGHNLVLSTTADANAVAADGLMAGMAADYVKPHDPRVIGYTKMIGGGETTSVTFDVAKLQPGTEYTYLCSFPGHSFIMRGTLKLGS